MKRAALLLVLIASHAYAQKSSHVLVMRAEGNLDESTRQKIDTQVLKLAKNVPGNVEPADISYTDATAIVGCSGTDASCREQVLATMGVDEMVATNAQAVFGGDIRVTVKRIGKGKAAPKEATTLITANQPAEMKMNADIGPLFGLKPPPEVKQPTPMPPPPVETVTVTPPPPTEVPPTPPPTEPTPPVTPPPPPTPTVTAAPTNTIAPMPVEDGGRSRKSIYGIAAGGGLVVVGVLLWGAATGIQEDINASPTRSPKDFQALRDLEAKGDAYTTIGNIAFIGGVAIAGVSGYFYLRDRRRARMGLSSITPAIYDHGAGITLTFGGSP